MQWRSHPPRVPSLLTLAQRTPKRVTRVQRRSGTHLQRKNELPKFDALSKQNVCVTMYANKTLVQPINPPILHLLQRFAQFLIDYRKSSNEEEDDDYDDEKDELGVLFESTVQKEYNDGLATGNILGHLTRIKSIVQKVQLIGSAGRYA